MVEKLGALLVRKELITPAQLNEALESQTAHGGRLGTNLVELGYLNVDVLGEVLGEQRKYPVATLLELEAISQQVLAMIPAEKAQKYLVLPLALEGRRLKVAMAAPYDPTLFDALAFATSTRILASIVPEVRLFTFQERHYQIARPARPIRAEKTAPLPPTAPAHREASPSPPPLLTPVAMPQSPPPAAGPVHVPPGLVHRTGPSGHSPPAAGSTPAPSASQGASGRLADELEPAPQDSGEEVLLAPAWEFIASASMLASGKASDSSEDPGEGVAGGAEGLPAPGQATFAAAAPVELAQPPLAPTAPLGPALDQIRQATTETALADALLAFCSGRYERAFLLAGGFGVATVVRASGSGGEEPAMAQLRVNLEQPSCLLGAATRVAPLHCPAPASAQDLEIFEALAGASGGLGVAALRVGARLVAFVVVRAEHALGEPALSELGQAAAAAEAVLAQLRQ